MSTPVWKCSSGQTRQAVAGRDSNIANTHTPVPDAHGLEALDSQQAIGIVFERGFSKTILPAAQAGHCILLTYPALCAR